MRVTPKNRLIILIPLCLSACALSPTQQEAARDFAFASKDIGEFSTSEFSHFRNTTIAMNVANIALRGKAKLVDDNGKPNLDESLKPETIAERIKAAQALSSYGNLLLSLVDETRDAELKLAANDFVGSFKSIKQIDMSEKQLEGLGRLVQSIGSIWVEAKKADAIKTIVPAVAKDVDSLCTLLINDFSNTALNIVQGYDATISSLIDASAMALKDPNASYADRLVASNGISKAWEERAHLTNISAQAVVALQKLQAANSQLNLAIKDDSVSIDSIKAVAKEVNSLKSAVSALSSGK